MKMINKKRGVGILVLAVMLVTFSCFLVSAELGLSSDFSSGNPIKVGPGQSKEVVFGRLQNTAGDTDLTLKLELVDGQEIASLVNNEIILPAGSLYTELKVRVAVPEDAAEGTSYTLTVRYSEVSTGKGTGMVTLSQSNRVSIPVLAETVPEEVQKEEETSITGIVIAVIIIIVIIILLLVFLRKKPAAKKK